MQSVAKTVIAVGIDTPLPWKEALQHAEITVKETPTPTTVTCVLADYPTAVYLCPPDTYVLLDTECKTRPWVALANTAAAHAFAIRLGAFAVLSPDISEDLCVRVIEAAFAPMPKVKQIPTMQPPYPALVLDEHQHILWMTQHIPELLHYTEDLYGRHISLLLTEFSSPDEEWRAKIITALGDSIPIQASRIPHPKHPNLSILSLINLQTYLSAVENLTYLFETSTHTLQMLSPQNILKEIGQIARTLVPDALTYVYIGIKHNALRILSPVDEVWPLAIHFVKATGVPLADFRLSLQKAPKLQHRLTQRHPFQISALQLPEITHNQINESRAHALKEAYHYQNLLLAPLVRPTGPLGLLVIPIASDTDPTPEMMQQLERLSAIATIVMEVWHLNKQVKTQQRQIAALHAVSVRVNRSLELHKVMQYAVEEVAQVLEVEASAISLIEPETGDLVIRAQYGLHTFAHTPVRIPKEQGVAWETLRKKALTIVESWDNEPRLAIPEFREEGVRATVLVPMLLDSESVGVLSVMSRVPRSFTTEELNLLKTLADQVAIALKNARLHEETRRQSQERAFLFNTAAAVAPLQDLTAIAEVSLRQTLDFLAWPSGAFLIEDGESGALVPEAYQGENISLSDLIQRMRETATSKTRPHTLQVIHSATAPRTIIQIPLQARNQTRGWLVIGTNEKVEVPSYTRQVLETAGNYLGVTIENVQLYQEMAARERRSRALYQVTRAMTGHDREKILKYTLEELHNGIPYDMGGVLLGRQHPLEVLYLQVGVSSTQLTHIEARLRNELSILGEALPNIPEEARIIVKQKTEETLSEKELLSYLEAPIIQNEKPTGAILLARRRPFQVNEQQMVFILAYQLSQVLDSVHLYHQAQNQAHQLQEANALLSEQEAEQLRIFDDIAHELYNPVTFVRGYTEVLLEEGLGPLNDTQKQAVSVLLKQANLLSRLVHRLGTIKLIDPQSLKRQDVDLLELLRKAAALTALPASRKTITINIESQAKLPQVWADSERISEVLEMLLRHIVQITPKAGKICMHAFVEDTKSVSVAITNSACDPQQTIPTTDLRRFYYHAKDHKYMGASMNLALCRRIIEAHGGSIGVKNDSPQDSTFYFRLPTQPPHPTPQ